MRKIPFSGCGLFHDTEINSIIVWRFIRSTRDTLDATVTQPLNEATCESSNVDKAVEESVVANDYYAFLYTLLFSRCTQRGDIITLVHLQKKNKKPTQHHLSGNFDAFENKNYIQKISSRSC